jgi:DnaJ-class molecular chaperone
MKIQSWQGPVAAGNVAECPRCHGKGYDDEYEEVVCTTCWGECEVALL